MKVQVRIKIGISLFLLLIFSCTKTNSELSSAIAQNISLSASENDEAIEVLKGGELKSKPGRPLYDIWRLSSAPKEGKIVAINPPKFQWKKSDQQAVTYIHEMSRDAEFKTELISSGFLPYCFYMPRKVLVPGQWFWRINTLIDGEETIGASHTFTIKEGAAVRLYPDVDTLIQNIPQTRPFILNYGQALATVLKNAKSLPKKKAVVVNAGIESLAKPIIDFEVFDTSKLSSRQLKKVKHIELAHLNNLMKAYLLTQDKSFEVGATKRLKNLLNWKDTEGMMLSNIMRVMANYYDCFHNTSPATLKAQILLEIQPYLEHHYLRWCGHIENRQIENHFWQMELSAFFQVALATVQDVPENRKYLDYAYNVFLVRSPVLGGNDGGWANGHGYFAVNNSTIINMAYMLQSIAKVPIFDMPWYKKLSEYFVYTAPVGGPIDGFGDMHDRRDKSGSGFAHCSLLALENNDDALARLQTLKSLEYNNGKSESSAWWELLKGKSLKDLSMPVIENLKQAAVYKEAGLVAMHTDVTNQDNDLALYFRSSPYGSNGHMHANNNSFNLSFKGNKIFYPTGYYTSFADKHSISSYKHTRASNSLLIDGKGQSFGHEGYGWIKRYLHGEKITYSCGDASLAYGDLVNEQWSDLVNQHLVEPGRSIKENFGDVKLKKFDRHIAYIRPNIIVIYDELEAEEAVDWDFLLHTMKEPQLTGNKMTYEHDGAVVEARFFSSNKAQLSMTDEFYQKPVDFLKKYRAMPKQFHLSFKAAEKSKKQRFLCVIQCGDSDEKKYKIDFKNDSKMIIGPWQIQSELDCVKPAKMTIQGAHAKLFVNAFPAEYSASKSPASLLVEQIDGRIHRAICTDKSPAINE
ncbi:DUF4962 domain-containing protein [Lentisphaera profundi]|uniref:DUF4962 domain-containing protein n=1 Tax=Lentisphaera profundi TaxID=1658616 RepID=A0ABY7VQK3_9BACT|nr:DUF4962 domain-containing protein [Lentisphaera profundi]WDE96471.1 DUF4962 domain-containing protein [Lentisphaera profundi]